MPQLDARRGAREALVAAALLIVLLALVKSLGGPAWSAQLGFALVVAFQLYVPLWLIERTGEDPASHGIHAHGLFGAAAIWLRRSLLAWARRAPVRSRTRWLARCAARFVEPYGRGAVLDREALRRDLVQTFAVAAITFPPFVVGHHFWQLFVAHLRGRVAIFAPTLPSHLAETALVNLFLVALPEELFYRGFVFTRLERARPARLVRLGVPLGWSLVLSSGLFALGHYAGEWGRPDRLGPFFPALLFAAMRARSGSIFGCTVYHALANIVSEVLRQCYTYR